MAGLTLVGVGPGDPNLLTVAAVRAIEAATVVRLLSKGQRVWQRELRAHG
jgi:precorrin-2 methylase